MVATLVGATPFAVALIAYLRNYVDLFEHPQPGPPPTNWLWKGTQSILIAALGPLIIAVSRPGLTTDDLTTLLACTVAVIFVFFSVSTALSGRRFTQMTKDHDKNLTVARLVCLITVSAIVSCAAVSLYAGQ